ncbi:MAG: NAD(P)H-dependent oxidoreductase subunit E [Nitrospinae bacterium]|nr:NAD(P)H-dependent oxidoreductase subunit E [Nitrospinota bacterium]
MAKVAGDDAVKAETASILAGYPADRSELINILWELQDRFHHIPKAAIPLAAQKMGISQVDVMETITFYHFFTTAHTGEYTVYLNNSITSRMAGFQKIRDAFEKEAGCSFGETDKDGRIGLFETSCIGMCDQEPSALINGMPFGSLTPFSVERLVKGMREGKSVLELMGVGQDLSSDPHKLARFIAPPNIRRKGPVLLGVGYNMGESIRSALKHKPGEIIDLIKNSNLRGMGGAGFPTALKWQFCASAKGDEKYIVCNADEGEPGTFKDRVLLTEWPARVFEGMAAAAYAVGARQGYLYLRAEYRYLTPHLQRTLDELRKENLLGNSILGKSGFDFDISIRLGAGAYVCGEESALLESLEGKRGEPRNRPPFPVVVGFRGKPTVVNNVETFSLVAQIIKYGGTWFNTLGTAKSVGTKILSVSGDCGRPGVYEVEWGRKVEDLLKMFDAGNAKALQIGGPSGKTISARETARKVCFEDLATGGSMIVFGQERSMPDVAQNFIDFFAEESCGACVPCRAGNPILSDLLKTIREGRGLPEHIDQMVEWANMIKASSRCGLGQSSPNSILTSIEKFKDEYMDRIKKERGALIYDFDIKAAMKESCEVTGRTPSSH